VRDYRGLEEITDAVSRGLLVGDVIVAVDLALTGEEFDEEMRDAIRAGESLIRDMAHPDRATTLVGTSSSLVATGAAVGAATRSIGREPPEDVQEYLDTLAESLELLALKKERREDELRQVISLFSFLGDLELARANDVSHQRQDPVRWLGTPTPSHSS
jgi:hypothetical protein